MALEAPSRTLRCPDCDHIESLPADFQGSEVPCGGCGRPLRLAELLPALTPASGPAQSDPTLERTYDLRQPETNSTPERASALPSAQEEISDQVPDPLLNTVLGKVLVQKRLGEGGMGLVYLGRHQTLDIDVAVKVLPPATAQKDRAFVDRFLREARTAARIHHPNVVQVFDVDYQKGYYYIVQEYIEGETAGERLRRKRMLTERETVEVALGVALALEYARRKNIIHRDVKPENILLSKDGEVKLADLGLAKRVGAEGGSGLTLREQALGTPYYIAPEQAHDARKADHRSDLYSLGATMFHLSTGRVPFSGTSAFQTMMMHVNTPAPELRAFRAELSVEIAQIIKRLLTKDAAQRFQTGGQLIQALRPLYDRLVPAAERAETVVGLELGLGSTSFRTPTATISPPPSSSTPRVQEDAVPPSLKTPPSSTPSLPPGGEALVLPAPPTPQPAAQAEPRSKWPFVLSAEIQAPADRDPNKVVIVYPVDRPSKFWLLILFVPLLNCASFVWVAAKARRLVWGYWALGLLIAYSVFGALAARGADFAGLGFLLTYLSAIVQGFTIKREFEVRATELARERDENLRRTIRQAQGNR